MRTVGCLIITAQPRLLEEVRFKTLVRTARAGDTLVGNVICGINEPVLVQVPPERTRIHRTLAVYASVAVAVAVSYRTMRQCSVEVRHTARVRPIVPCSGAVVNQALVQLRSQSRCFRQIAFDQHAAALHTAATANGAMAHRYLAAQPCSTATLVVTGVLQHKVLDACRQHAVSIATHKTHTRVRSVQNGFRFVIAEPRQLLVRPATANNRHTVLEGYTLVVRACLHEHCIARLAVVYAQTDRALGCLPGLAVLAIIAVSTHVPRSSRRTQRRCHEIQCYESEFLHFLMPSILGP